jgi:hypothetical protein
MPPKPHIVRIVAAGQNHPGQIEVVPLPAQSAFSAAFDSIGAAFRASISGQADKRVLQFGGSPCRQSLPGDWQTLPNGQTARPDRQKLPTAL